MNSTLLQPKEITVTTPEGKDRAYIISRFPAIAGREIMTRYIHSGVRPDGYADNEAAMLKIMGHVAVKIQGRDAPLALSTPAFVNNHVPDWETLARIEEEMIRYNASFTGNGRASAFLAALWAASGSAPTDR